MTPRVGLPMKTQKPKQTQQAGLSQMGEASTGWNTPQPCSGSGWGEVLLLSDPVALSLSDSGGRAAGEIWKLPGRKMRQ